MVKRKKHVVLSDDSSDASFSVDDTQLDSLLSLSSKTRAKPQRKPAAPADDASSDDEVFRDDWGEDLMGDEEDRRRVEAMNEVEREELLLERAEKRETARELWLLNRKLKQKKTSAESGSARGKKTTGSKKDRRAEAMKDLKARRTERASKRAYDDDDDEDDEDDDEDGDDDDDEDASSAGSDDWGSRKKKKKTTPASRGKRSKKRRASDSDDGERGGRDGDDDDDDDEDGDMSDREQDMDAEVKLEEMAQIVLSRQRLEAWANEPFFAETVVGFYVRISIGKNVQGVAQYRIARIVGIKDYSQYKLENGKETTKQIICKLFGSAKNFKIIFVSSSKPPWTELEAWARECKRHGEHLPTRGELKHLLDLKAAALNFRYTDDVVRKLLDENEKAGKANELLPIKIAKLTDQVEHLKASGDHDKAAEVEAELVRAREAMIAQRSRMSSQVANIIKINQQRKVAEAMNIVNSGPERRVDFKQDQSVRTRSAPKSLWLTGDKLREAEENKKVAKDGDKKDDKSKAKDAKSTASEQSGADKKSAENDENDLSVFDENYENGPGTPGLADAAAGSTGNGDDATIVGEQRSTFMDIDIDIESLDAAKQRSAAADASSRAASHAAVDANRPVAVPPAEKVLSLNDYLRRRGVMQ